MQKNIINSVLDFYQDIEVVLVKKEAFFYIENPLHCYIEIKNIETLTRLFTGDYRRFFISSEPFIEPLHKSFYAQDFFHFVIEGMGGRCNETEIEAISLRVISKNPDKKIKAIYNAIANYLKANEDYKMGIEPMSNRFYRNIFYKENSIKNKTLWFDFERKIIPIKIAEK